MNDRSPVDLTQPDMLQKLDRYMKPLIRPFVYKWAKTQVINHRNRCISCLLLIVNINKGYLRTFEARPHGCIHVLQELSIKQQLDCGVRYCDLRIAHRPNDSSSDLYFYHGVYTTLTVEVKQQHADTHVHEVVSVTFMFL